MLLVLVLVEGNDLIVVLVLLGVVVAVSEELLLVGEVVRVVVVLVDGVRAGTHAGQLLAQDVVFPL